MNFKLFFNHMHIYFLVWLIILIQATGCDYLSRDTVKVKLKVSFVGGSNNSLKDVYMIAGGDKFYLPVLATDQEESITLKPGSDSLPQLTFIYTLNGKKQFWDGPDFPIGTSYRIELLVNAGGVITQRNCILPCSLK